MAELLANSAGLSPSALAEQKDELKRRHKAQLHDFDSLSKQLIAQAERDLLPYINVSVTSTRARASVTCVLALLAYAHDMLTCV